MRGLALLFGVVTLSGCGSVYYGINISAAEARVEQAREMGAERQAPFEYYYAREHLHEARVNASEASYGDAAHMAERAETYAQRAIDKITTARKGGEKTEDEKEAEREKKAAEESGWK